MPHQIVIGVLVVVLILLVCMMWHSPASEPMVVTHSNHGPYEYDTLVNGQYIRAVDPLMLRPLVNPLIGIAPINPIADVSGFTGL